MLLAGLRTGLVGLAAAACTTGSEGRGPAAVVDPDLALRDAAVLREVALLAAYDATLTAHAGLARDLRPLREEHATHLLALTGLALRTAGTPTPPCRSSHPPTVPARPAGARAALRRLETTTQVAHREAAVTASARLAPVLASLAACEASHVAVL